MPELLYADCFLRYGDKGVNMPSRDNTLLGDRKSRPDKNLGDAVMAEETEKLLTVREVARHLRVDDTTVRRWIKSGSLEAITLPHRGKRQAYRIKQSTLDALLKSPRLPG
jgi:excisionase family DNA binding protein